MKKILLIVAMSFLALTGCEKENDNEMLMGTCWSHTDDPEHHLYEYKRMCFGGDASLVYKFSLGGERHDISTTYVYNKPNVVFTFNDGSSFKGRIEDDVLYIEDSGPWNGTYRKE